MNSDSSPSEIKQRYIDELGEKLGSIFYALLKELVCLNDKWDEFVTLYGTKPERLDLLNASAAHFFMVVQNVIWDDTLLHIYRLTCPSKSGRGKSANEQLTINRLPSLVDEEIHKTISKQVKIAVEKSNFCHEWRHNKIAHPNLDIALKKNIEPLPDASRAKVNEAIKAISCVLNTITKHYLNTTTDFEPIKMANGAESLLYVLDDGLKAQKERTQRIKERNYTKDDLKHRDL